MSGLWGKESKPALYAVWALTLAAGFVILGGLGALQDGAPSKVYTPGAPTQYPYRLAWTLWTYEVFVLLLILGFTIKDKLNEGRVALVGFLAPVIALGMFFIETFLYGGQYLPGADGTAVPSTVVGVGLIILTIGNFLLLIIIGLYHEASQLVHLPGAKGSVDV